MNKEKIKTWLLNVETSLNTCVVFKSNIVELLENASVDEKQVILNDIELKEIGDRIELILQKLTN